MIKTSFCWYIDKSRCVNKALMVLKNLYDMSFSIEKYKFIGLELSLKDR